MDTIQDVLCQVKKKAEALNLKETDLVLDHAIYCKALEIKMSERNTHLRSFFNLRMGGFHATCVFLSVIGKRFANGRLKDLIVESRLLGEDQASQMLKGKDYNNGIWVHLYLMEAINKMKLESFENWLVTRNEYKIYEEMKENGVVQNFKQSQNTQNFEQRVEEFRLLLELYDELNNFFQTQKSIQWQHSGIRNWTWFKRSGFIKSTKNGDWDLHMYTSEKMLYWFPAYDNYNYARHFLYYWASQQAYLNIIQQYMKNLKKVVFLFDERTIDKFNK